MNTHTSSHTIKKPPALRLAQLCALALVLAAAMLLQSSGAMAITTERVSVDSAGAQATGGRAPTRP